MILFSKKSEYCLEGGGLAEPRFTEPRFAEQIGNVLNPGRGWYRIYTYTLGEGMSCDLPPVLYEGEKLALVLIDIGAYREAPIPEEGLAVIEQVLAAFAHAGVGMLLRIVYDTTGKGMEHEPSFFSQVLGHIAQLGPLLAEYAGQIVVFQGVLVGSWGEMHTSKFVANKYLRQLAEALLQETRGRIKLAFRAPAHLRRIAPEGDALCSHVGFFDDALLADETHLGTFSEQSREEVGWANPWRAEEEAGFLEEASSRVPFGGEALKSAVPLSPAETIEQLRRFHVSYLNCVHDAACLEQWRNTPVQGEPWGAGYESLYDYVGAHLGYRFVLEKAEMKRKGKEHSLTVLIANKGFACCPGELELAVHIGQEPPAAAVTRIAVMPGDLQGNSRREYSIPLEKEQLAAGNSVFLSLRQKDTGLPLRFANEGAKERLFLGRIAAR